ncbi:hypothetical protein KCU64_g8595, partial [Aureobasidium melanogenum]
MWLHNAGDLPLRAENPIAYAAGPLSRQWSNDRSNITRGALIVPSFGACIAASIKNATIFPQTDRFIHYENGLSSTYGHSQLKTGHPVRSAIHKQLNGRLVLRWVTTWESLL